MFCLSFLPYKQTDIGRCTTIRLELNKDRLSYLVWLFWDALNPVQNQVPAKPVSLCVMAGKGSVSVLQTLPVVKHFVFSLEH